MIVAFSVNGVSIRLTEERLDHIQRNHPKIRDKDKILETISNPDLVQKGDMGSFLAIKKFAKTPVEEDKYLVVVYKEITNFDGFVLTAYYTSYLKDRIILWKKN